MKFWLLPLIALALRGVDDDTLYRQNSDAQHFKCFKSEKYIPLNAINDDYCDCPDGSDEPGTAACPNGHFYCLNKGYIKKHIKSMFVNDGVCDCCDGSDEWKSNKCDNNCDEVGSEYRRQKQEKQMKIAEGLRGKEKYAQEGKAAYETKEKEIANLTKEILTMQRRRDVLYEYKIRSEEREKLLKERQKFASCPNRYAFLNRTLEVMTEKAKKLEAILIAITERVNIIYEGKDIETFSIDEQILTEAVREFEELKNSNAENIPQDECADALEFNESEFKTTLFWFWNGLKRTITNREWGFRPFSDLDYDMSPVEEYFLLKDAEISRSHFNQAETRLNEQESKLAEQNKLLNTDFGHHKEFYYLSNQCFQLNSADYTYELCPFVSATQIDVGTKSRITLGRFKEWRDGHTIQVYEKGTKCWHGPDRSVTVRFHCDNLDKLVEVLEPNKCEYVFNFHTLSACHDDLLGDEL